MGIFVGVALWCLVCIRLFLDFCGNVVGHVTHFFHSFDGFHVGACGVAQSWCWHFGLAWFVFVLLRFGVV